MQIIQHLDIFFLPLLNRSEANNYMPGRAASREGVCVKAQSFLQASYHITDILNVDAQCNSADPYKDLKEVAKLSGLPWLESQGVPPLSLRLESRGVPPLSLR